MKTVKKLITLDQSLANDLELVAKSLNKTQREVIELALDFYFDYTDGIIADKITDDIKKGTMKVYSSKEVYKKLGIDFEG
ncbi:MAG: hypothetical protein GYA16_00180 [Spirochaetes bacterium]|nr:hypothetical protein [Spirochaetota bacterium]HOJ30328.1 hypothetical protein [Spirochaetota bacterium]HOM11420.1 hypothetical protein [Spirochaetota bacterium]HPP51260.1 hypothetical protein [Spirochaetota bacterium]